MWVSPGATGQSNDAQVTNELAALGKGFAQHGQRLADLVIGLSVGNEDIYRFNSAAIGVGSDDLVLTVKGVREKIAASPFAKFMQGKPIGHTDTAQYAVVAGSDFAGMTGYPYWEGKSIDNAKITFMSILNDTEKRAGDTPVWISEMGWPINGTQKGEAVASAANYQRYWDEVGCQLFGRYNVFWFELLQDSQPNQPDWGLLDTNTHQPRIRNLSCGGGSNGTAVSVSIPSSASAAKQQPTTFSTVYLPSSVSSLITPLSSKQSTLSSSTQSSALPPPSSTQSNTPQPPRTIHTTLTLTTTIPAPTEETFTLYLTTTTYVPSPSPPTATSPTDTNSANSNSAAGITVCIAMLDLLQDGTYIPVAIAPPANGVCAPPPRFAGMWDLYAPTPVVLAPLEPLTSVTAVSEVISPSVTGMDGPTVIGSGSENVSTERPVIVTTPASATQP